MKDLKYYVVAPSVKLFGGIKVTKETEFEEYNDDKTVHQTMKDLVLTTEVNRTIEYDGIKSTEKSTMTSEIPEGTVLIWGEKEGFVVPQYNMVRAEEAIEALDKIKEITVPIEEGNKNE